MQNTQHPGLLSRIGRNIFIRTVTHYFRGRVLGVTEDDEIVLEDASWVAVTGRFGTMLAEGGLLNINEVEPYPTGSSVFVNRHAVVDWCDWMHTLPREQK